MCKNSKNGLVNIMKILKEILLVKNILESILKKSLIDWWIFLQVIVGKKIRQ